MQKFEDLYNPSSNDFLLNRVLRLKTAVFYVFNVYRALNNMQDSFELLNAITLK